MTRERERTVYSTGKGRICPLCGMPAAKCVCRASPRTPRGDGVVRVRREVQGRHGKTVTSISGVPLPDGELRELASELKRRCGTGGSAKDGVIEIQGDHRDALVAELEARGYTVKRAGG
jgi:translation initiation factor 1